MDMTDMMDPVLCIRSQVYCPQLEVARMLRALLIA